MGEGVGERGCVKGVSGCVKGVSGCVKGVSGCVMGCCVMRGCVSV